MEWYGMAWLAVPIQSVFFNLSFEYIIDVAIIYAMVLLFKTYFGQMVFSNISN